MLILTLCSNLFILITHKVGQYSYKMEENFTYKTFLNGILTYLNVLLFVMGGIATSDSLFGLIMWTCKTFSTTQTTFGKQLKTLPENKFK